MGCECCCNCACCKQEGNPTKCYKLKQQELWYYSPDLSPKCIVFYFYLMAFIFIPLGVTIIVKNKQIQTVEVRYDEKCPVGSLSCLVNIQLDKDFTAPLYLYYGLTNFYQNMRRYVDSVSYPQLRGEWPLSSSQESDCNPIKNDPSFISDINPSGIIIPCGLQPWSFFNDTIYFCQNETCGENSQVKLTDLDIAWNTDIDKNFQDGPIPPWTTEINDLITDQEFMNWIRLGMLSSFFKLYRIIEQDLTAGTYTFAIDSNFPTSSFEGKKLLMITQTKFYGGKNDFLGILFVTVGGVLLLISTLTLIQYKTHPFKVSNDPVFHAKVSSIIGIDSEDE